MNRKYNFSAGPSILPKEVFEELSVAALDYNGTGLSIMEISHRSDTFVEILEGARSMVRELYSLPDHYEVLFLSGGATTQFSLIPLNLLPDDGVAAYIDTGTWSAKAIKEANKVGKAEVIASSEDKGYNYIPKDFQLDMGHYYLHLTSNNTIYGTQYHAYPESDIPLIVDMCSDVFSRPIDATQFDLIYAGAQKNLGPAGTTMVIINKNLLGRARHKIPLMFDYSVHIEKKSALNTPPVYAIYGCYLNLKWIKAQGLAQLETQNKEKARLMYEEIDRNSLFKGITAKEDRSLMNATFTMRRTELEEAFAKEAEANGLVGIKGHRSVGGFRVSMYNAMSVEGVQTLVDFMKDFEGKNA